MSEICAKAPVNKKEYIGEIGTILVQDYGKKKYYKPEEVKKAHQKSSYYSTYDISCWALSIFSSHSDFDEYHAQTGEICDYATMKSEMLAGLSASENTGWFDLPDFDIDMSWLDFGDGFGDVLGGIGEFFGGILDGF